MAPHSSTLAWKIPWMEEPGRLQSMGSLRVGHDWVTSLSLFTFMRWRRKWQPTPVFLPGEFQGHRSLLGCCLWGRTESTWLKRLSSSSSSSHCLSQEPRWAWKSRWACFCWLQKSRVCLWSSRQCLPVLDSFLCRIPQSNCWVCRALPFLSIEDFPWCISLFQGKDFLQLYDNI